MTLTPPIRPFDPLPLRDRVVLVSGGAQGIGRGIAQAVIGAGGIVAIGDLDAAAGKACLAEWAVGPRASFQQVEVARETSVRRWVEAALAHHGHIDGLVNNAGVPDPYSGPIDALSLAAWRRWLDVGLGGAFLCSKHALPALRLAGGVIVNVSSTRAHQSEPHTEAYAAAKGGLVALTHALAISEGPAVRVNCISPGWIATDAWRKPTARRKPKLSARDKAQHPAGRVGTPEDIGQLAVLLLGPTSGFVTGQEFIVDGGMTRKMQYA